MIEVIEGEVYDTPLWLKPILNTIPEFGLDGRRKEFFCLIYRCNHCQYFFGNYKNLFNHKKLCSERGIMKFVSIPGNILCVEASLDKEVSSTV